MNIATHNSATGEKGGGLLSFLVAPFSICQSKTLIEQYLNGCRYFDFRVKKFKRHNGQCYFAHGLWRTKRTFQQIADEFYNFVKRQDDKVYIMLTYEGDCTLWEMQCIADSFKGLYPENFILTSVNIKKPYWRTCAVHNNISSVNCYKVLDGRSWHTFIPIPWLWAKLYLPKFKQNTYNFIDFL